MGDIVPFDPARRRVERERRAYRLRIKVQRASKFRIEMPVLLEQLRDNYEQMSDVIDHYVADFCADKGAPEMYDRLRLVFVGGFQAAKAADQAWFTDYISPGMILLCWEADA